MDFLSVFNVSGVLQPQLQPADHPLKRLDPDCRVEPQQDSLVLNRAGPAAGSAGSGGWDVSNCAGSGGPGAKSAIINGPEVEPDDDVCAGVALVCPLYDGFRRSLPFTADSARVEGHRL